MVGRRRLPVKSRAGSNCTRFLAARGSCYPFHPVSRPPDREIKHGRALADAQPLRRPISRHREFVCASLRRAERPSGDTTRLWRDRLPCSRHYCPPAGSRGRTDGFAAGGSRPRPCAEKHEGKASFLKYANLARTIRRTGQDRLGKDAARAGQDAQRGGGGGAGRRARFARPAIRRGPSRPCSIVAARPASASSQAAAPRRRALARRSSTSGKGA